MRLDPLEITGRSSFSYGRQWRLHPAFWVALAVATAMCLPNLIDPMIRHDDYPALLGRAEDFWSKTLHEGRWLNYLWHLRKVLTPAWVNHAVYQICWVIFASVLAIAAAPPGRHPLIAAPMAALIVVAPPAALISLWFNTLLPGLALVAVYALVVHHVSQRTARWLLPVFILPTFMAYTTYPILLLALCLARTGTRSLRDLAGLLCVFTISFAAAILATYTLNWHVHGVFGIPLADWRNASPAHDLGGLLHNLSAVRATFVDFATKISVGSHSLMVTHLVCFTGAITLLARHARLELAYLGAGLLVGVALTILQAAKLGVLVPTRALLFIWVFYALIMMRGAQILMRRDGPIRYLGLMVTITLVVIYAGINHVRYAQFHEWQAQTHKTAAHLATLPGPVHVQGSATRNTVGQSAGIQSDWALYFRLFQLAGRDVVLCQEHNADCNGAPGPSPRTDWHITQTAGKTWLVIPDTDAPNP
ncbi:hypothetical protein [Roseobacter sp.]|uniref:hypothetical protein n=1 Tax=Roseobacter sp. TaxID=1907202 RepID=UPI003299955B